jgi:hypothetical protein
MPGNFAKHVVSDGRFENCRQDVTPGTGHGHENQTSGHAADSSSMLSGKGEIDTDDQTLRDLSSLDSIGMPIGIGSFDMYGLSHGAVPCPALQSFDQDVNFLFGDVQYDLEDWHHLLVITSVRVRVWTDADRGAERFHTLIPLFVFRRAPP